MDYLTQLELDIKKEHIDLLAQLSQGRNILRQIQTLPYFEIARNPLKRKIKIPQNYLLRSINLIVCSEGFINPKDPIEKKLQQILTNYYFEIQPALTKFTNTGTYTSSRLFERYLSKYLDNQCEDIFITEDRLLINIFDFKYAPTDISGKILELYIQENPDPSVSLSLEYIYQKNEMTNLSSPYIRPKNSSDFFLSSDCYKVTQLIRNSGYCFGMVLSFIPNSESDDDFSYPSLEKIQIYPGLSDSECVEFGSDDFKTIETPVFKYVVLIFDPNYRSDENISEMLDGFLFDSKKIHGINFTDTTDPPVNQYDNPDLDDEEDEEDFSCCSYKLEFNKLDFHGNFRINENFYYLDCIEKIE